MKRNFKSHVSSVRYLKHFNPKRNFYGDQKCDPLRILFCGSDAFSIASLKALHREHTTNAELIESIDVVCKVGKPHGRGLKTVRQVPIVAEAKELSLPIHQIPTFTGWQPPKPNGKSINLIIAVSFGLLVPPRILRGAKYGGLNVHPSLLPEYLVLIPSNPHAGFANYSSFRGAAPLHHTLLSGCRKTGISLQTLHPKQFDHGRILSQTPWPGFDIPRPDQITVPELTEVVAPEGAKLLIQGLKDSVHVTPTYESKLLNSGEISRLGRSAPKITPDDRHIRWNSWTADDILRRNRIIGPLWSYVPCDPSLGVSRKRVIWNSGFQRILPPSPKAPSITMLAEIDPTSSSFAADEVLFISKETKVPDKPGIATLHKPMTSVYVSTVDGELLMAKELKVEGKGTMGARDAVITAGILDIDGKKSSLIKTEINVDVVSVPLS